MSKVSRRPAREAAKQRLLEYLDPVLAEFIDTALQPGGTCPTCGRAVPEEADQDNPAE